MPSLVQIMASCQPGDWTNAGILLIPTLGTNPSEILSKIRTFAFKKMYLKINVICEMAILSRPQCVEMQAEIVWLGDRIYKPNIDQYCSYPSLLCYILKVLTHKGLGQMAAILQTTLSNAFPWMKMFNFLLRFCWIVFLMVRLTMLGLILLTHVCVCVCVCVCGVCVC